MRCNVQSMLQLSSTCPCRPEQAQHIQSLQDQLNRATVEIT